MVPGLDQAVKSLEVPDTAWEIRHFRPRVIIPRSADAPARVIFEGEWYIDCTQNEVLLSTDEGEVFSLLWSTAL